MRATHVAPAFAFLILAIPAAEAVGSNFDEADLDGRFVVRVETFKEQVYTQPDDQAPYFQGLDIAGVFTFDGAGGVTGHRRVHGKVNRGTRHGDDPGDTWNWEEPHDEGVVQHFAGSYVVEPDGLVRVTVVMSDPLIMRDLIIPLGTDGTFIGTQQQEETYVFWLVDRGHRLEGHAYFDVSARYLPPMDGTHSRRWRFDAVGITQDSPCPGPPTPRFEDRAIRSSQR